MASEVASAMMPMLSANFSVDMSIAWASSVLLACLKELHWADSARAENLLHTSCADGYPLRSDDTHIVIHAWMQSRCRPPSVIFLNEIIFFNRSLIFLSI